MTLPEKGVILSLRFKKYVYVTLTTSAMWQLLLYSLIPSGWTILLSVLWLSLMAVWYFDKDNPGNADPICIGLTLSYILLLVLTSTLILRLIFNLDEGDVICGVFLTLMASAIAYIASMFEVDYKELGLVDIQV